eukprot:symbB.v1.2.036321.t2/scaffold5101.1/size33394/3
MAVEGLAKVKMGDILATKTDCWFDHVRLGLPPGDLCLLPTLELTDRVEGLFAAMQIIDVPTCTLLGEMDIVPDGLDEFEPRTPCRVEVWSSPFKLDPIQGQHILNDLREFDRNWSAMTAVMAFICPTKATSRQEAKEDWKLEPRTSEAVAL